MDIQKLLNVIGCWLGSRNSTPIRRSRGDGDDVGDFGQVVLLGNVHASLGRLGLEAAASVRSLSSICQEFRAPGMSIFAKGCYWVVR